MLGRYALFHNLSGFMGNPSCQTPNGATNSFFAYKTWAREPTRLLTHSRVPSHD